MTAIIKEKICETCEAINQLEFTLRAGNASPISIRCKGCKRILQIELPPKSITPELE